MIFLLQIMDYSPIFEKIRGWGRSHYQNICHENSSGITDVRFPV